MEKGRMENGGGEERVKNKRDWEKGRGGKRKEWRTGYRRRGEWRRGRW
jgi:hypothetical protein